MGALTAAQLLEQLRRHDIRLWCEDGNLRYDAARGALNDELRAQIADCHAELLLLLDPKRNATENLPIVPVPHDGPLPLSFAQHRLWFLEQMDEDLTAYNLPEAVRLRGQLDVESLRQALETIVHRHESLRTTFEQRDGNPRQIIQPSGRFVLSLTDLCDMPTIQQEAEVTRLSREEAERPFDLKTDLMLRASLLRLAEDQCVLLLTMHHIASDGWSRSLLWQELRTLYEAYRQKEIAQLPALPIQYADYAVWQRDALQGPHLRRLLVYWREQLDGLNPLELPTDRPRPPQVSYRGATFEFQLPGPLCGQLQQLSRAEGVTLQMTLLAAFQTLLWRYSGQHDIAVGTPIMGRNHIQLENQVGLFVNMLVLRTDLSQAATFRELLIRVRQTSLEAYDHQDLPFERVVEELQPQRHLSRSPLVQVLFQLENTPHPEHSLPGLEVSSMPGNSQHVKFELEMHLRPTRDTMALACRIVYSTDLFEVGTIERLAGHFQKLLEEVVADPDISPAEISLLTGAERRQLLVQWNDTAAEYPRDMCVHQLFEQQAHRTPDAAAVDDQGRQLTYRELNEQANQLAHFLRNLGVGPGVLVALCLERSREALVGILGILKAGGAYVPLDPNHPQERLDFMLQDAAAGVLVTRQKYAALFSPETALAVCLDAESGELAAHSKSNLGVEMAATNPAYVIFTSGSTGRPKGIIGRHQGIINRLCWMWNRYPYSTEDVCCQKTTLSFVDSVAETFGPLLQGVRSVIIRDEDVRDVRRLLEKLANEDITRIVLVPSLLQALFDAHPELGERLPRLKYWITSGESLPIELWRRFDEKVPRGRLVNLYGSTEVAGDATCFDAQLEATDGCVPIGSPIWNTEAYVLDKHLQPLPIGVPGELYLGGDGLAMGYLNRPELSAEHFISHPFSHNPHQRLFCTGDRVRWRVDGNLEILGRLDHQVKIRGIRIELGEIEAALNEHPDVAQSVVTLREDRPGEQRLAAYCVPLADTLPNFSELQMYLRTRLPDYMVPAVFVSLDTLPLTFNGKLNRSALPTPEDSRPDLETGYVAPRNPVEQQVATIWCEVLGLDRVGIRDNFFELGGHSLLALRLIAQVEQAFGEDIFPQGFFGNPTVAFLASLVHLELTTSQEPLKQCDSLDRSSPIVPTPRPEQAVAANALHDLVIQPVAGMPTRISRVGWCQCRRWVSVIACALPYSPVFKLLDWVCKHRSTQLLLFHYPMRVIREFHTVIDSDVIEDQVLHYSLLYCSLLRYRIGHWGMTSPYKSSYRVNGLVTLQQEINKNRGVVLLLSHDVAPAWLKQLALNVDQIGGIHVESGPAEDSLFSYQFYEARQTLLDGGLVSIAGDCADGRGSEIEYDFHGRRRTFQTGFAELAIMTGASVIVVRNSVHENGQVETTFLGPLDAGHDAQPDADRVAHLVTQYVAIYHEMLAKTPWMVPWFQMQKHLSCQPLR